MKTISKELLTKKNKLISTEEVSNIYSNAFKVMKEVTPNYPLSRKGWEALFKTPINSKETKDENN